MRLDEEIEESSSSNDDDEPIRAPMQLKIEFINSIMFRQWELAKKLCQFMLMYEPDNAEAQQFAPLIDYMLAHEQSSSSSSSDDDDTSDDDGDGDDSSATGDSSSSTSSDNDDEEEQQQQQGTDADDVQAPKPVNASLSRKCPHH
ncbi:unnamed protein product [Adineta ricciae]|uniref:Uncharacterized protein n=1 Tax=Adineta ricciae TaxID=249248 RepID=A0A814F2C0_ADIRI|nr:unnamed protein product [Adineta ricciae]